MNNYKSNRCSDCGLRSGNHKSSCLFINGIENVDYVKCFVCGYKGKNISQHLKKAHNIPKENYSGLVSAPRTFSNKSKALSGKENWITKYKRQNPQKAKQKIEKMGKNVSVSILNNNKERQRRSNTMKAVWSTYSEKIRETASKTAIKTSKRPDVLQQRTENLRKWRENNPDKIRDLGRRLSKRNKIWRKENPEAVAKSIEKALRYRTTKPEKELYEWLTQSFSSFNFKFNQMIHDKSFQTKTKRRQLDVVSWDKKIVVEYDGVHHFKEFVHDLKEKKRKDKKLNEVLSQRGYSVIRISYDQYHPTKGFKQECLDRLNSTLVSHKEEDVRCVKIGRKYYE